MYPTIVPYFSPSDQSYGKRILPSGAAPKDLPASRSTISFWYVGV